MGSDFFVQNKGSDFFEVKTPRLTRGQTPTPQDEGQGLRGITKTGSRVETNKSKSLTLLQSFQSFPTIP